MKFKLFFTMLFVLALSGCGGENAEAPTEVVPEQNPVPTTQNEPDNLERLVNPEPILALSQVGNINNTPQFVRAQKIEQEYKNGQPHRELTIHFYRNGPNRFHGPYKEWYPSGTLWKEGLYEENSRVGQWKWYAENGELVKDALYNEKGLADGNWTYFHDNGTKRRIEGFKEGKRHGRTEYYNNDGTQLLELFSFKNDRLDGEVIRWFPLAENQTEPQKQNHSTFLDGKRNGVATEWYPDGQIQSEVGFKNGNRHGRTRRWDKDGNIELDLLFDDGEPVDPSAKANDKSGSAQPESSNSNSNPVPDSSSTGESAPTNENP